MQPPRKLASRHSKYFVLGLVGRGQFGSVYCAVDRRSGEMVALKEVDSLRLTTQSFLRELRFLAMSQHPSIVTWRTCEHFQEGRYIVMDYCEGGTLRSLIEQRILKLPCALGLVRDILAGLAHIHDHGLIHCDLKPENILLRCHEQGWQAHLSDFGIARLLEETLVNVETLDSMAGSPAYMAPERFDGELRVESDLYAVGIILHELLLGHRPFSGTPSALIEAHRHQPLQLPLHLPLALRSILQLALHKAPDRRFHSAHQMQQAIERLLTVDSGLSMTLPAPELETPTAAPINSQVLLEDLPQPIEQIWQSDTHIHCLAGNQLHSIAQPNHPTTLTTTVPEFAQFLGNGQPGQMLFVTDRTLGQLVWDQGQLRPWQPLHHLAPDTQVALDPTGRWLAMVVHTVGQTHLEIWSVAPWQRQHRVALPEGMVPWKLLFLTPGHVGVVCHRGEHSAIALFSRRGHPLGEVALPLRLVRLQPTGNPYQLIALEPDLGPLLLQIKLKPFSLHRMGLPDHSRMPKHLTPAPWGYLLGDRQGRIDYLDPTGQRFKTLSWPRPILEIAPLGRDQLLIASPSAQGFGLYQVSS